MTDAARHRLALVLVCAAAWLPGLAGRTLWPPDEPRYALVARDMIERGDYIVPYKAGEIYHSQPPLFLWAEILAAALTGGMSEWAARLPSFMAAVACVLVTRGLAARMFGASAGLASGLVLATSVRFLLSAQWAATDMLLCALITGCLARLWRVWHEEPRRASPLPAWILAGLAALTKGPVGLALPALVAIAAAPSGAAGALRRLAELRPVPGLALAALVAAPWYIAYAWIAGGDLAADLILQQSVRRYLDAWNNQKPWHYFLWRLPLDLLPWSPALLAALPWSWRAMPARARRFLWTWLGVVLLFFSLSSGKRGVYILPLYPAASILIGWCLVEGGRRLPAVARRAPAVILAAAGLSLLAAWHQGWQAWSAFGAIPAWLGSVALSGGLVSLFAPARAVAACTAITVALLSLAASVWAVPVENRRQNVAAFSQEIARHVPPEAALAMVEDRFEDFVYYSGRGATLVRPGPSLRQWLDAHDGGYAVLDGPAWDDFRSMPDARGTVLFQTVLAEDPYSLIRIPRAGEEADGQDPRVVGGGAAPQ